MLRKTAIVSLVFIFTLFFSVLKAQSYTEIALKSVEALEQQKYDEAEQLIRQALALEPANVKNALLFSNLGLIQRNQEKYDDAIESYTFALNLTPYSIPVLLNRAAIYLELGEVKKSYVDYCLIIDLDSENIEALLMRAYINTIRRDYIAARIDYKKILSLDENHYNAQLGLATLLQTEKKYKEATEQLTQMITQHPQDALLLLARANVAFDMEQWDMALLDAEEAEKINPELADIFVLKGEIYIKIDKKHQAKTNLEQAILLGFPQVELSDLLKQCK